MNLNRKYRPSEWKDFYGNAHVVRDLKKFLRVGDPPHMIFVGPPGCGKNTAAYIFATKYLGRNISVGTSNSDPDYLELNASDERGIDTARGLLKDFSKTKSLNASRKRIAFVDEFDNSTQPMQMAMRAILEKHEHLCIFIFSMNHLEGIKEEALLSRCAVFQFSSPSFEDQAKYIEKVAASEGITFGDPTMPVDIARYYKGDMRRVLNDCMEALRGNNGPVQVDDLSKIYSSAGTRSIVERVLESGHPKWEFFRIYQKEVFDIRHFLKLLYEEMGCINSRIFAKVDARLRDGANPVIQLGYLFDCMGDNS